MGLFSNIGKKVKNTAIKTAVKHQLKKMDPAQRQMFEALMENNPELLEKIALETQELIKGGETQMGAMMKIGKKYQHELAQAMQSAGIDPTQLQKSVGDVKGPF